MAQDIAPAEPFRCLVTEPIAAGNAALGETVVRARPQDDLTLADTRRGYHALPFRCCYLRSRDCEIAKPFVLERHIGGLRQLMIA